MTDEFARRSEKQKGKLPASDFEKLSTSASSEQAGATKSDAENVGSKKAAGGVTDSQANTGATQPPKNQAADGQKTSIVGPAEQASAAASEDDDEISDTEPVPPTEAQLDAWNKKAIKHAVREKTKGSSSQPAANERSSSPPASPKQANRHRVGGDTSGSSSATVAKLPLTLPATHEPNERRAMGNGTVWVGSGASYWRVKGGWAW